FVYDGHGQRVWRIVLAERAALDDWNRKRAEIIRTDLSVLHIRNIVQRFRRRAILESKEFAPATVGERQRRRHAGSLNTRQRFYSFDQLLKESGCQFGPLLSVLGGWKRNPHRQDAIRSEAGIDALQSQQTVDHQTRANQQHK